MTWVKIDEDTFEDPKIEAVGHVAFVFWMASLCYCNKHMTDGRITRVGINKIAAAAKVADPWPVVDELMRLEMLCREDDDDSPDNPGAVWWIVNYSKYQPMRDRVAAQRAANARRQALFRNEPLKAAIRQRDANTCRYCGTAVSWSDRRSPEAAGYDHVNPGGGNTFENLVVACRGCNSAKGSRTPESAGMRLLPPPNPHVPPPNGNAEPYLVTNQVRGQNGVTASGLVLPEREPAYRSHTTDPIDLAKLREARVM